MQTFRAPKRLWAIIIVAGFTIGAGFAFVTLATAPPVAMKALPPLGVLPSAPNAVAQISVQPDEAVRRPPFSPSRRPVPKLAPGATSSDNGPELLVTGIIAGPAGNVAIGIDKRTQKPFSLRPGGSIAEWHFDTVSRDILRLRRQDQIRDYPLTLPPPPLKAPPPS